MKGIDKVATTIRRIFRQQKIQAEADKERFGDWNNRLATELRDSVLDLYLQAARSAAAKAELAPDFVAAAKARAIEVAREINRVTSEWLQEGRTLKEVFGTDRVTRIAATEAAQAISAGKSIVAESKGERLQWVNGRKPCKWCKSVNGKIVRAGKPFGILNDTLIYHPPAHPHCYCSVKVVK